MSKGLFITATGTDVGKIYVTVLIVKKLWSKRRDMLTTRGISIDNDMKMCEELGYRVKFAES